MTNDTLMRSVAASLYLNSNKIIVGQEKDFAKNPRVFIDKEQPLIQVSIRLNIPCFQFDSFEKIAFQDRCHIGGRREKTRSTRQGTQKEARARHVRLRRIKSKAASQQNIVYEKGINDRKTNFIP